MLPLRTARQVGDARGKCAGKENPEEEEHVQSRKTTLWKAGKVVGSAVGLESRLH